MDGYLDMYDRQQTEHDKHYGDDAPSIFEDGKICPVCLDRGEHIQYDGYNWWEDKMVLCPRCNETESPPPKRRKTRK